MVAPPPEEEKEFDIIREVWSSYDLEDGTILRCRTILTKVMGPKTIPKEGPVALRFAFHQINTVTARPENRGPPNPNPLPIQQLMELHKEEVEVVTEREAWNVYRLRGVNEPKGLKTKSVVASVFRVPGQYDQEGNPQYIINSTTLVVPARPKDFQER